MTPGEVPVLGRQADAHDLGFLDDVVVEEDPGGAGLGVGDVDAVHGVGDARVRRGAVGDLSPLTPGARLTMSAVNWL